MADGLKKHLDIWVVMVEKSAGEWRRCGPVYRQKHVAASWVSLVKAYWHGATTRVRHIRVPLIGPGQTTEAMRRKLADKYAIDLRQRLEAEPPGLRSQADE